MWIFKNDAFISIVQHRDNHDLVMVRARIKNDLINTFGNKFPIIELDDADYKFRMILSKEFVADVIKESILEIDYDNFKNSISEDEEDRHNWYTKVWSVMYEWQYKLAGY